MLARWLALTLAVIFGLLDPFLMPYPPLIALAAAVLTPIIGLLTGGKYYLEQTDDGVTETRYELSGSPVSTLYHCVVCQQA